MSATAKVFGALLLILGVLLLIGGLAAAVAGSVDAEAARDDCGAFGCDEEREMADNAAIYGGATAAGLGFLFTLLGIGLLMAGSKQGQQQQQQVVVEAGASSSATGDGYQDPVVAQQQQSDGPVRDNRKIGIGVAAGLVALLLFTLLVMGSVGTGPAADVFNGDTTDLLDSGSYDGRLSNTGRLGGVSGADHVETLRLHDRADYVYLEFQWTPADTGSDRLHVVIEKTNAEGRTIVKDQLLAPGAIIEIEGESRLDLSQAQLHITVGPPDQTFILDQSFTVQYQVYDS